MCLGIPGKVEMIVNDGPLNRSGLVRFGGIQKQVDLSFVEEAVVGDYVIVHAGFAISRINEAEAQRIFITLGELGELEELEKELP